MSVYIEVVASDMFGAGAGGMINPPDPSRYYSISVAELAVFDRDVYDLLMDLTLIYDIAKVQICSHYIQCPSIRMVTYMHILYIHVATLKTRKSFVV